MTMFYRDHSGDVISACSSESIGVQYCANKTALCSGGHNPIYTHTSEDPSVFVDSRGGYSHWRDCQSAATPSPSSRRFNTDAEGASAK